MPTAATPRRPERKIEHSYRITKYASLAGHHIRKSICMTSLQGVARDEGLMLRV